MAADLQRLTDDVSYLKQDMAKVGLLVDRLDATIDKLAEVASGISRLLAVHESKLTSQEIITKQTSELVEKRRVETDDKMQLLHARISSGEKEMQEKLDVQYDELLGEIKEMRKESAAQHEILSKRISSMEKWMWGIMGAAGLLTILIQLATKIPWHSLG
jgi:hypothetical protein